MKNISIRESNTQDYAGIEKLYAAAFSEEDLLPLVRDLLTAQSGIYSHVATLDDRLVGHAVATFCSVGKPEKYRVGLLGPIAVSPDVQKQGIGSKLIRSCINHLSENGFPKICVLGDPSYYGRFEFAQEAKIVPPYDLPAEWSSAWQSLSLSADGDLIAGTLLVPAMWQKKELWSE